MYLTIKTKMMILIGTLVAVVLLLQGIYLNLNKAELISDQIGLRALNLAKAVAVIPELIDAFDLEDPAIVIQPLAESLRQATGAEYVVVGNRDEIRYSHPVVERLGQRMVGGDNMPALMQGESYVSQATGTLGEAMRGKVPIFDSEGDVIGVVSVGFMLNKVANDVDRMLYLGWLFIAVSLLVGVAGAVWIANHVKKLILGLEPHEIARLVHEKEAILQSIHEGVVAINREGKITVLNQSAKRTLSVEGDQLYHGVHLEDLLPNSRLMDVLNSGEHQFDRELWIGDVPVVVNRVPIFNPAGELDGAVSTFRSQKELLDVYKALKEVSADVDQLREQAHEFSNKLHTISGLLQLNRPEEALALIHQESLVAQNQVAFLVRQLSDPVISAMLLGKIIRAQHMGVHFDIEETSSIAIHLSIDGQDALLKIMSNLLDNAFDAATLLPSSSPQVRLFFTDLGAQLLIEVEDNGPGLPAEQFDLMTVRGYSTKKGRYRGIGLALVRRLAEAKGGNIYLEESELGGACFVVSIDKSLISQKDNNL